MVIALCIEASNQRGAGHLFRAMVLAQQLKQLGNRVHVVVNDCIQAIERLAAAGIECLVAPVGSGQGWERELATAHGVQVWINDRLNTDLVHANDVKALGIRLVTFDDYGEGAQLADLNICSLAGDDTVKIPGHKVLTGEAWLVLPPGLSQYRRQRTVYRRLLVTMGGSDTYGVTLRIVRLLLQAGRAATVITGPLFACRDELRELVECTNIVVCSDVPDLGTYFHDCDLAITGGGLTAFEAAATGLPLIVVANERHEIPTARRLVDLGCACFAGFHQELDESTLLAVPKNLAAMSAAGMDNIPLDGAQRVCSEILDG